MRKIGEASRSGLSDADLDIQDTLNREPALFRIELCHSRFFGCPNDLIDVKELGTHGVARPVVTGQEGSECGQCLAACLDRIISLRNGRPVINSDYCRLCGACARACPTGVIETAERGVRILAGGTIGRFARYGREIFRMTEPETIFGVPEAISFLLKSEWSDDHEDHFSLLLSRTGIAPLYEHLGVPGSKGQPK